MLRKFLNRSTATVSGLMAPLVPAVADAGTTLDTTAVETQFGNIETALVSVGGVIIAAAAVAVGFKWIKGLVFS